MLEGLVEFDKKLLLLINSWNTPWLDNIMISLTNGLYWLPLFLLVIGMMIYKYRWETLIILLYLIIVIVLADQISSSFFKPFFARLRPSHDPEIKDLVHLVNNYRGGMFSFVSSHATNAFGIATFLFLASKKKIKWIWVMFIWATIFSYTRLYLGVHYPLDIICGGLLGAIIAYSVYKTARVIPGKLRLS